MSVYDLPFFPGSSTPAADGATGEAGYSPTITTSKSGKVTTITITDKSGTKTAKINDGVDGSSVTVSKVVESDVDGGDNVVTFSDGQTLTVKNGSTGKAPEKGVDYFDGQDGYSPTIDISKSGKATTITVTDKTGTKTKTINDGADGTSVSITDISESDQDGGSNIVTFSDGNTLAIKNGSASEGSVKSVNGIFPDEDGNVEIPDVSLPENVTQMLSKATPKVLTIVLDVDKWVEDGTYYSQAVELDNITHYSRLDLQPDTEIISDMKSLGVILITKNTAGNVFVESVGNKPTKTYSIQATIVETEPIDDVDTILGIPVGAVKVDGGTSNQDLPDYVQSLEECVDTTKVYVLPDGYAYKYSDVLTDIIVDNSKPIGFYSNWAMSSTTTLQEPITGNYTLRIKGAQLVDSSVPVGGSPCAVFMNNQRFTVDELTIVENSEHGYEYLITIPNSQTLTSISINVALADINDKSKLIIEVEQPGGWRPTALCFVPEDGADFKAFLPEYSSDTYGYTLSTANKSKQYTLGDGYTYKYAIAPEGATAITKASINSYSCTSQLLYFNASSSTPTSYPLAYPMTVVIRNLKLADGIEYNGEQYAIQFVYGMSESINVKLSELKETAQGYEYTIESGATSFQVKLSLHTDNSYSYDPSMTYTGYIGQIITSDGRYISDFGVDLKHAATGKWEKVTEHRFVPSDFDYTVSNLQQTVNQSIRSINWKYGEGGNVNLTFDDIKPQFAYSTAECWDKTKDYLLPDGYVYRYNDGYQSTYSYENVDLCVLDEDTHTCYIDNYTPFCGHDNASLPYTFVIKNLTLADKQTDEGYGAIYVEVNGMSRWFTLQNLQSTYVDGYVFQLNENYYGSITINNINIKMFVDESAELVQPTIEVAVYEGRGFQPTNIRFFPQDGSISGSAGGYYIPYISDDGWLSWTPSDPEVMPTPGSVNIKGPQGEQGIQGDTGPAGPQGIQGEKGNSGVYIGAEEPTDGSSVWIDLSEDSEDFSNEIIQEVLASLPIYDGEVEDI